MSLQHDVVIKHLEAWAPATVLNIGLRYNSDLTVYNWCVERDVAHTTVEIHVPNCQYIEAQKLGKVIPGDIRNIAPGLPEFDAVIWLHGPEHLTIQHLGETLAHLEPRARKGMIVQMPFDEERPAFCHGNPWERHLGNPPRQYWETRGYVIDETACVAGQNTVTYVLCK